MPKSLPDNIFARAEEEPLVLTGPPTRLAGQLELRNPGSTRLVLRGAGFRDPSGTLLARQQQHPIPPLVLRPEQGRSVPLSIALDTNTPPGEYQIELNLAGQSRPVLLHVTEAFSLTLRPGSIVVSNQPGQAQRKRIFVTNTGNVAFNIGDIGEVDLKDDLARERAIRIAVEPWSDRADVDIEKIIVAVLQEVHRREEPVGRLVVHIAGQVGEVKPGESIAIDIDITVPEGLPRSSRYRGRAALLTQDLEIIVVPSGGPVESQPHDQPKEEPAKVEQKPRSRSRKTTRNKSEKSSDH
jgi:hypothetical protein